jgi:ubiquinone/menaquinone biosynthesis C-methylase UbiE
MTDRSFDPFAREYDFMASLSSGGHSFFIDNMSDARGAALDIGCGSGLLCSELAKNYETVIGVDNSGEMLAIARERRHAPNIEYILMDASRLAMDMRFDLIVSAGTFHHLDDLPAAFQAIKCLLNPNGRIVIQDIVSKVETPATLGYLIGAIRDFVPDVLRYDHSVALRLFRFRTSLPWLRHLASDRFLSEQSFTEIYGRHFPGCSFVRRGISMAMIWENRR